MTIFAKRKLTIEEEIAELKPRVQKKELEMKTDVERLKELEMMRKVAFNMGMRERVSKLEQEIKMVKESKGMQELVQLQQKLWILENTLAGINAEKLTFCR